MKKIGVVCGTLLCLAFLFAGCRASNCTVAPAPEATESITTVPESAVPSEEEEHLPEELVLPTADQMAAAFVEALQEGDIDALERTANPMFNNKIDFETCWAAVKLNSIAYEPIEVQEQGGLYTLTLDVTDAGQTSLKTGKHAYVMTVGHPYFGDDIVVVSITPKEKFMKFDDQAADAAITQVNDLRGLYITQTFATPADIDKDLLLYYLIVAASIANDPEARDYELTQEDIDAVAKQYFGMDSFVHTTSKFYNKEKQLYELWGGDGIASNSRIVRKEVDAKTGNIFVFLETYQDSLQVVLDKTIQYTLSPNADDTFRFVSAVEVEAL